MRSMRWSEVADDRFDSRTPPQLPSDLFGHAPLLACGVDLEARCGRRMVAAIAGIGEDAVERHSDLLLHLRDHGRECVAIVRVTGQRFDMGDELAALRVFERRCRTRLHAELIGAVCLALSDAFDFRSMVLPSMRPKAEIRTARLPSSKGIGTSCR